MSRNYTIHPKYMQKQSFISMLCFCYIVELFHSNGDKKYCLEKSCSEQDTVQNMFLTEIIETGMKVNDRQVSIGYYR